MTARAWVGTSGFEYGHWRGEFYPADLARSLWLEKYAATFETVELNATFYRLPGAGTFQRWAERVPASFRFAVKASRYLTHVRRLREPAEPLERLWSRARLLGPHLGPVLYQLPPRWRPDPARLDQFLAALPAQHLQAIEVRDPRWYSPEVLDAIRASGTIALCLHDMPGSATSPRPIGPFAYVRFHGAGARYAGRYPSQRLAAWADRIAAWTAEGRTTWVFFNNDLGGHAPRDALRLRDMLSRRGVRC